MLDMNCGLRDKEPRELRWRQVDLIHKKQLPVGKAKTEAGTGLGNRAAYPGVFRWPRDPVSWYQTWKPPAPCYHPNIR